MSTAESLLHKLDETRQRWWLYSMLCNIILVIVASGAVLLGCVLLDVLFRLPQLGLLIAFVAWSLVTAVMVVWTVYRLLKYQRDLPAAARQVELSFPELGNDLINLVQLSQSSNGAPEGFRRAAINEAAERASRVPLHRAAYQLSRWWRWRLGLQTPRDLIEFLVLLGLLGAATALLNLAVPTWSSAAVRLFRPWEFVPQVGSVKILEVRPGDADVVAGSRLEITARIDNPKGQPYSATLHVEPEEGEPVEQPMAADQKHQVYRFRIPAVVGPLDYWVQIGDSQSNRYAVTVRQKPTIQDVEVTYEYPRYLNQPNHTVQQQHADLEAPQFTVAHLRVRCSSELGYGYARLGDESIHGEVDSKDAHVLLLRIPLVEQASYTIHLFDKHDHTDPEPRVNTIRIVPDAPPVVQLVKPASQSTSAPGREVAILARASDDHGLGQLWLEMKVVGPEQEAAEGPGQKLHEWDRLAAATTTTRKHTLVLDAEKFRPGQIVLVRAVATDLRHYRGQGLELDPQQAASAWHRIQLVDPQQEATEELKYLEGINARLWAILQKQLRARLAAATLQHRKDLAAARPAVLQVRKSQIEIQTDTTDLVQAIRADQGEDQALLKQALSKVAHGQMLQAVQQAEALAKSSTLGELTGRLSPLLQTQDQIIDLLRRLLQQVRQDISQTLAEMEERPGGDLPDEVADKLRQLKEKLQEFTEQQRRVIEATENLAKKPVEDFTAEDQQLLENLAAIEDDWSRFLEETHSDFSKLPEQDFSNPSLLQELVEVQTEIKMAEDALTKKTADIAVPLEQLGAEMAEELVTNLEKWLPDTPDRERWSQEEPLTDAMKEAPMAELPGELEDLVGELMEEEEDLFDEMEDVSSSWADSLDKGAGWDAADGPISNMSAKGVTGNRLPNTSEIGGRSGEGRQGKASGEFVGDTAVGKGGRKTPSRLSPDPYVDGEVKDVSKDPVGGATGGGKTSGAGGEGLEGPVPHQALPELQRMAKRQADLRNRAESIDLKFQVLNYHHTDLKRLIDVMAAVEDDLRSGRYYSALRRREVLLDGLGNVKTYLEGEFEIRRDQTPSLPEDVQKELLGSMQEESPPGWEELNRKYFESLATQSAPEK